MKKTFNPQNPWVKLGNAIALPLILSAIPFIAAYVIYEAITNKQDEN